MVKLPAEIEKMVDSKRMKRPYILPIDENKVYHRGNLALGNGATYTGQVKIVVDDDTGEKTEVKHGKGCQVWADGSKYEGDWRDGLAEGVGTLYRANGDVHKGEFIEGRATGFGTYTLANGDIYETFWKNDKQVGPGRAKLSDGSTYVGGFKDGMKHG